MSVIKSAGDIIDISDPNYGGPFPLYWSGSYAVGQQWGPYDPAFVFRTQPAVRKVVGFLARNFAQLGLQAFDRVAADDRQRLDSGDIVELLMTPTTPWGPFDTQRPVTQYEFHFALLLDVLLWDRYLALKIMNERGKLSLVRIPPVWWYPLRNPIAGVLGYRVGAGADHLPVDEGFSVLGYTPNGQLDCPPMETLRSLLVELEGETSYREQLWRRGARMGGWIKRPASAPKWSDTAQERFKNDWVSRWTAEGGSAGGTPILEDDMEFHESSFSAEQSQWVTGRELTLREVCTAYYVPPELLGIGTATYSNLKEYSRILYADTLGPSLRQIEQAYKLQVLPDVNGTSDVTYVEFNVKEKLRGSFEEQIAALQSAVGAPWMTRNEARAYENMPPSEEFEADHLVTPLNVIVGGQPSPRAPTNTQQGVQPASTPGKALRVKALHNRPREIERYNEQLTRALKQYFAQQHDELTAAFKSHTKATANVPDLSQYWNGDSWDAQLGTILARYGGAIAMQAAQGLLDEYEPGGADDFSDDPIVAYMRPMSHDQAKFINSGTYKALVAAIQENADSEERDEYDAIDDVYANADSQRADQIANTHTTASSSVGEDQAAGYMGLPSKVWTVTSPNPRPSHAEMDGEEVGRGETFSNGARWPGDVSLDVSERANCSCRLDYVTTNGGE